MKLLKKTLLMIAATMAYTACSEVQFSRNLPSCTGDQCKQVISGGHTYEYSREVFNTPKAPLDILFVDDNSASMHTIHVNMQSKFNSFITSLNNKSFDYRIAITTTDISSSYPATAANQYGALQDGLLVNFASGLKVLTPSSNANSQFLSAIQRQETLGCENWITANYNTANFTLANYQQNCPSNDERGIMAANKALDRNEFGFRPEADLHIIVLSNEDERSTQSGMESDDYPTSLINRVRNKYSDQVGKVFGFHAIVAKDESCRASLSSTQFGDAHIGQAYIDLANNLKTSGDPNKTGTVGNICSGDYTAELNAIFAEIDKNGNHKMLKCTPVTGQSFPQFPGNGQLKVVLNGTELTYGSQYTVDGKNVIFSNNIPSNATIEVFRTCQQD